MNLDDLLTILTDRQFHSGEELSRCLGVSRTAIWKQIAKLETLGLEVNAVKGKGYRLRQNLDLLSLEAIRSYLDNSACKILDRIDLFLSADSTNRIAAEARRTPYVCLAEMQTAGRGRRGRQWVSPFAQNIYLSLAWEFSDHAASLDSLSLCTAVAVAKALKQLGCDDVGVKWPNDLLFQNRKLAGILLEASGELGGAIRVIIGIGLNVAMTRDQGQEIDQQWVALNEVIDKALSRNQIVAILLNTLARTLPDFERLGFVAFEKDWQSLDCLINRCVGLHLGSQKITGIARGVDSTGALLIETGGVIKAYRGGEVSVRTHDS